MGMDPDNDIDTDEFLKGVAELEKECGDWRDHLPYDAACTFRSDPTIRKIYGEHVRKNLRFQILLAAGMALSALHL